MMSDQEVIPLHRLSLNMPRSEHEDFQAFCDEQGITMTAAVRQAIKLYKFMRSQAGDGARLVVVDPGGRNRQVIIL